MNPFPQTPAADQLQRLLRLRLRGQRPLQAALLQSLFGHDELTALDAGQRARLLALLESRSDSALEVLAWRGHAGSSRLSLQVDVLFDGEADPSERERMAACLLEVVRRTPWPTPTLVVRSVVVCDQPGLDNSRCSSSGR